MRKHVKLGSFIILCLAAFLTLFSLGINAVNPSPTWYVDARCFNNGPAGAFDEVSVKDPSIVYSGGKYHLFYTGVTSGGLWQMGYASATTIAGLNSATHTFFSKISEGYFCAPEVFYFEPQSKWYMIYNDGSYGAAYATTTNIADPNSWTGPRSLGVPNPTGYDFWIICDDTYAYLFNTQDGSSRNILWRRTSLANFPTGWSSPQTAATDTFEGVIVYKSLADGKYYMLPEDYNDNRYYELWSATSLSGPWTKIAEQWASYHNLIYNADHWTDNVSHGEIIRAGVNQKLEINDIDRVDFLIQGVVNGNYPEYVKIPWDLGVIRNYSGQTTSTPTPKTTLTPTSRPNTPTPTQRRIATATPTRRGPTPTPTTRSGGYIVTYTISSDWGVGANADVTIKNNTVTAVNGWTLAFTFPGNQKITNLWNGTYTQSSASVSVKDAGYNATIGANGGTTSFGFGMTYSGVNGKPTAFTINGTPSLVQ